MGHGGAKSPDTLLSIRALVRLAKRAREIVKAWGSFRWDPAGTGRRPAAPQLLTNGITSAPFVESTHLIILIALILSPVSSLMGYLGSVTYTVERTAELHWNGGRRETGRMLYSAMQPV
jgi:hypothetical protein